MKAIGLLCGVGTLLREAQDAGFTVAGNIELRPPFRTIPDVWRLNFGKKVPMLFSEQDEYPNEWYDADLAIGHPPCGSQSVLGSTHSLDLDADRRAKLKARRSKRVGLLPNYIRLVNELQPKIFALDTLPKYLQTVAPPSWWEKELKGYRLTFLTMVNFDYGTPQLRERLWVIGSKGKKAFTFTPPKKRLTGPETVWDAISDLPWEPWNDIPELAHVHRTPESKPSGWYPSGKDAKGDETTPMDRIEKLALAYCGLPPMCAWPYRTKTGRPTCKFGRVRLDAYGRSPVVTGGESLHHPLTGWPLTVRERARLMDWPDDFRLWDGKREFDRKYQVRLALFTGKAVPSRFPRYLIPQLAKHLTRI